MKLQWQAADTQAELRSILETLGEQNPGGEKRGHNR